MSNSPLRRAASAAAVAAAGVALLSAPAAAQNPCYPPTPGCVSTTSSTPVAGPTLILSSTTVVRGQTIQATAIGFQPGTSGIFTIASVEQQIGSFTVNAAGTGTSPVVIPSNIELGPHTAFARGTLNGTAASASRGLTVVASTAGGARGGGGGGGSGGSLARTGAIVVPTALVGLGLVAAGAALKRSSRRSKTSSAG